MPNRWQKHPDQRINGLLEYLRQHSHEQHDLDSLAQKVMMSRRTLTRHFMKATGSSVAEWLIAERLRRSGELLESSRLPVERIATEVGFLSPVTGGSILSPASASARQNGEKPFRV